MLRRCHYTSGAKRCRSVRVRDGKMYVPSDSFGGLSPERKASQALQSLFTFISAKIVLAQLEGSGRGALASYNQEQYKALFSHLQEASLSDPHAWLELLMRKDKALALRLMEVRAAYSKTDFEWDQLQRLSVEAIQKSNLQLMREAATASLQATAAAATPAEAASTAVLQKEGETTATTEEEAQEQQAAQQDQQVQPAIPTPAAQVGTSTAEEKDARAAGNGCSSNSVECADTPKEGTGPSQSILQEPSSSSSSSSSAQEQQQQEQQR